MSTTVTMAGVARHRRSVLIGAAVVLLLVVLAVLNRDSAEYDGRLDPRNPDAAGAQAVARVLADRGVEVSVARGQDALLEQAVDADTALVVTNPADLGPSTLRRLRAHTASAGSVVLVGDARVLAAQLDLDAGAAVPASRDAGCAEPLARGLVVRTYGREGLESSGCFGEKGVSALVRQGSWWLLTSPRSISNRSVLQEDNAALALRLLGQQGRLVWYVADPADLAADEGFAISELLPPWLGPSAVLLLAALLAVMLWRGRRLGPLVTEPLPVVVRAVESTDARGRIYRRTHDRDHAAQILREATRRRLSEALGLPPHTHTDVVADAAATRAARDATQVRGLLTAQTVPTDAALVQLGRRLIDLENEVQRP